MKLSHLLPASLLLVSSPALADTDAPTIIDHITKGTDNTIVQPDGLLQRLIPVEGANEEETKEEQPKVVNGKLAGYRVQVFSDNNARTAKNEARSKQRIIASRFPKYQTYVMYTSPYWRLKVGDFRTQQEAKAAADDIGKAFPAYKKEIRIVRDRVNIHN